MVGEMWVGEGRCVGGSPMRRLRILRRVGALGGAGPWGSGRPSVKIFWVELGRREVPSGRLPRLLLRLCSGPAASCACAMYV